MAGIFSAASFRTLGSAATPHNIFTIENIDATKLVYIRRLTVQLDATAVLTSVMPQVKASRATAVPTGGTALNKAQFDTANASNANTIVRGATASDGGAATAITATAGTSIWQQYCMRMHTVVEQVLGSDENALPRLISNPLFRMRLQPGESMLVSVVGAAAASNAALANNWSVNCEWEEDSKSTFAISGTITLSGSPVAGARVMVMESDDVSGTNMFLRETIVTGAGGTWASSILTGKIGAAFVQYETGGTYYTAPGSPFLS